MKTNANSLPPVQTAPVDPAKGNELLKQLFGMRPLPIAPDPPSPNDPGDNDEAR